MSRAYPDARLAAAVVHEGSASAAAAAVPPRTNERRVTLGASIAGRYALMRFTVVEVTT